MFIAALIGNDGMKVPAFLEIGLSDAKGTPQLQSEVQRCSFIFFTQSKLKFLPLCVYLDLLCYSIDFNVIYSNGYSNCRGRFICVIQAY